MRRSAVPALLGVLAVVLVAVLGYALTRTPASEKQEQTLDAQVEAGTPVAAPGAAHPLPELTGSARRRLADYRGQVVVLNFWGSWCDPCRDEAPLLEKTHRQLRKAGVGTVLGITFNDAPADSLAFEKKFGLTYTSLRDPGTKMAQEYGARAMPETFVLDRQGRIHAIARTQVTEEFLDSALERAGVPKDVLAR